MSQSVTWRTPALQGRQGKLSAERNFADFIYSLAKTLKILDLFNSLPNDKILAFTKFKAFADDKIIVIKKLKFVLGRVENIVGKGEHAGYQHFLLFPQCFPFFSKAFFSRGDKYRVMG